MVALTPNVHVPDDQLTEFCRRWKVTELALFGSVLRPDFRSDSDIDVLVDFEPDARHTLFKMVDMEDELRAIFGRDVDLVEKRAILNSDNYLRRRQILDSAQVVYDAR